MNEDEKQQPGEDKATPADETAAADTAATAEASVEDQPADATAPVDDAAEAVEDNAAEATEEPSGEDAETEPDETTGETEEAPETSDEAADTEEETEAAPAPRRRSAAAQREPAPEGITALFGRKLGMLQVFDETGTVENVTAIELGPCVVTMVRTPQRDGYHAVQLGWGEGRNLNKPAKGHLAPSKGDFRYLREVRVDDASGFSVGQEVTTAIFEPGQRVDVTSTSKGRGFAGGVKRHGFRGGPKTHGQSDRHRAVGSIGAGTTPGHVLKGQRMPGHMGARQVTVRSLTVVSSDTEKNLLLIRGSVPGPVNSLVRVKHTTRAEAG